MCKETLRRNCLDDERIHRARQGRARLFALVAGDSRAAVRGHWCSQHHEDSKTPRE